MVDLWRRELMVVDGGAGCWPGTVRASDGGAVWLWVRYVTRRWAIVAVMMEAWEHVTLTMR